MNLEISGNLEGRTVFFLAGFPDTSDVFNQNLLQTFEQENFRLVKLSLPGCGSDSVFSTSFKRSYHNIRQRKQQLASGKHYARILSAVKSLFCTADFCKEVVSSEECVYHANEESLDTNTSTHGSDLPERTTGLHSRDELFSTSFWGHSFNDLTTLFEIAVLTAMRTHNYYSPEHWAEEAGSTECPPADHRPLFIAHGWGSILLNELLLSLPNFFSRVVLLDVGASVFDWENENLVHMREVYGLSSSTTESSSEFRPKGCYHSVSSFDSLTPKGSSFPKVGSKGALDTSPLCRGNSAVLRSEQEQQALRNSLSARYASRYKPSKPRFPFLQYFLIQGLDILMVVFYFFVPRCVSRWCMDFFLYGYTRPSYYYDTSLRFTPEIERLSEKIKEEINEKGSADALREKKGWKVVLVPFAWKGCTESEDGLFPGTSPFVIRKGYTVANVSSSRAVSREMKKAQENYEKLFQHTPSGTSLMNQADAEQEEVNSVASAGGDRYHSVHKTGIYYEAYFFPIGEENEGGGRRKKTPKKVPVSCQVEAGWLHLRYLTGCFMSALFGGLSSFDKSESERKEKRKRDRMYGLKRDTTGHHPDKEKNSKTVPKAVQKRYSPLVSQRYFFPLSVPVLFMYGDRKIVFLHSQQWCTYLKEKREMDGISDVVRVHGGGHYFFTEEKYKERVAERILQFALE